MPFLTLFLTFFSISHEIEKLVREIGLPLNSVSIFIIDDKGDTIVNINGAQPFTPASTLKIITAGASLEFLGPSYQWTTYVLRDRHNNLYFVFDGDPTFDAKSIKNLLIQIKGKLPDEKINKVIFDLSKFDRLFYAPGIPQGFPNPPYIRPVSSLNISQNIIEIYYFGNLKRFFTVPDIRELRISKNRRTRPSFSLPSTVVLPRGIISNKEFHWDRAVITKPDSFGVNLILEYLKDYGFEVKDYEIFYEPAKIPPHDTIGVYKSITLREVLYKVMKNSDNFYFDIFFKTLGKELFGPPATWEKGRLVLDSVLRVFGVDNSHVLIYDGSGLSTFNKITTRSLAQLLREFRKKYWFPDFLVTLPVEEEDGTLRFRSISGSKIVRAKTGTLPNVRALAGYIFDPSDYTRMITFSVMIEKPGITNSELDNFLKQVVNLLLNYALNPE